MRNSLKRLIGGLVAVALFTAVLGGLWFNRFGIFDWWRLRNYQVPAEIAALADHDTMTNVGRRLFYVYHPKLDNKEEFSGHCTINEQTIVLGCYVSQRAIYLYDVTDVRLNGVEEVTAAHEMLHAAYDRLGPGERTRIDELTNQALTNIKDQRILDTIESYRKADPSVVPNELHSILGTEVANLPAELEQHYSKFFTDRSKVVAYSNQYEAEFTGRKQKIAEYDSQLAQLKIQIDAQEAQLKDQQSSLQTQKQQLDAKLARKDYEGYNAMVAAYNASAQQFNKLLADTKTKIDKYNQLVQDRNAIASEQQQLINAIDSRLQSQPTQ